MTAAPGGEPSYSLRSLGGSALLYSSGEVVLRALSLLLVPLYTRLLDPEAYGIVGFASAVVQIVGPLAGLGLIGVLPVLYHGHKGESRARLVSTIVNATVIWGGGLCLLLALTGRPLLALVAPEVPFAPYMLLALGTVLTTAFFALPLGLFNIREQPGRYAAYSVGLGGVNIALALVLVAWLRWGATGVLAANLLAGFGGVIVTCALVAPLWRPIVDRQRLRESLVLALPALPHLLSASLYRFADRIFLTSISGLADTGVYSLAVTLAAAVLVPIGGMTNALAPLFYRRAHLEDPALPEDWARLSALFAAGSMACAVLAGTAAPAVIRLVTPEQYHGAAALVPVLVVAQVLTGCAWLFAPLLGFRRRLWALSAASVPAMVLNLAANLLLVPRLGGAGASLALLLSAAVQFAVLAVLAHRGYPVPYQRGRLGRVAGVGVVLLAAFPVVAPDGALPQLATAGAFTLAAPLLLAALGFFDARELAVLRRMVRAVRRGAGSG